jgi:hypothetical protein
MSEGIRVATGLFINEGFESEGAVVLRGARVTGKLSATGGHFRAPSHQEKAIDAQFIEAAEVELDDDFHATGRVSLDGSRVISRLNCDGGQFNSPDGIALSVNGLDCAGDMRLGNGLVTVGEVQLLGAKIERDLSCTGGTFKNSGRIALSANGLICRGSVFLNKEFHAVGTVELTGAHITMQLNCTGGTFECSQGSALRANGLRCDSVFLNEKFRAMGTVELIEARIATQLNCTGGTLECSQGSALRADGLICGGSVFLNEQFHALGAVVLVGARITTQLNCTAATLHNDKDVALRAVGLSTEGDVYLNDGFRATGEVQLIDATVGRQLNCRRGQFETVSARGLKVGALFDWRPRAIQKVDVSFAEVGQLRDEQDSWPVNGQTKLAGLMFQSLGVLTAAKQRSDWLRDAQSYAPNVYQQLIRIYRRDGREEDAEHIAIATERERRRRGNLPITRKLWSKFLDVTVRYGYRIQRVLYAVLALGLVFSVLFSIAQKNDIMEPIAAGRNVEVKADTCTRDYPCFLAPAYSFELLFPVVNLRQVSFWLPSASTGWGCCC